MDGHGGDHDRDDGLRRVRPQAGVVGNSADNMASATEFDRAASMHNFVVAYPEGLDLT